MLLGGGDRALGIFGDRHDAIARIVLDQIFERHRQLAVIFDDEDIEHPRAFPDRRGNSPRKIRDLDAGAELIRVRIPRECELSRSDGGVRQNEERRPGHRCPRRLHPLINQAQAR